MCSGRSSAVESEPGTLISMNLTIETYSNSRFCSQHSFLNVDNFQAKWSFLPMGIAATWSRGSHQLSGARREHLTGRGRSRQLSSNTAPACWAGKWKPCLVIAGLGNVVWSSYLHSGGAREVEDTNRRFGSLQPSPEKKQKVSTSPLPLSFSRL